MCQARELHVACSLKCAYSAGKISSLILQDGQDKGVRVGVEKVPGNENKKDPDL